MNDAHGKLGNLRLDRLKIAIHFQGRLGNEPGRLRLAVLIAPGTLGLIKAGGGFLRRVFSSAICFSAWFRNSKASCQAFTSLALRTEPVVGPSADCCLFKDTEFHSVHHCVQPQPTVRRTIAGPSSSKGRFTASSRAGLGASLRLNAHGRHRGSAPCTMRQGSASHPPSRAHRADRRV